jgi:SAM-dependent methyltransferase
MRRLLRQYRYTPHVLAGVTFIYLVVAFYRHQYSMMFFVAVLACIGATCVTGYASRMNPMWPRLHEYKRSQYREVWDELASDGPNAALAAAGMSAESDLQGSGAVVAARISEHVGLTPQLDVVEIACGVGRIGREIAPLCGTWTGCDISKQMLLHAANRMKHLENTRFQLLAGQGLQELPDGSADIIYCTNALPHFDMMERWRYVRESYRVLRRGGRVYMDTVALDSPEGWMMLENNLGQRANNVSPPYMPIPSTPDEFSAFFGNAGFNEVQTSVQQSLLIVVGRKG